MRGEMRDGRRTVEGIGAESSSDHVWQGTERAQQVSQGSRQEQ